ncbi:LANO_0H20516g1_1 [Lachancea nothofagi CBS 11611]|uniref:LANO_0H20516g1_1 n=1 Tax=Lachancea nothofagi CBS 11611 TaxID=1266666 RepID=A0A1G4KN89_9SACH|nr:LANO_0H20516g1_1 [Lachancea nothofagi CBS 11611]
MQRTKNKERDRRELKMPEKLVIIMVGLPARGKSYIAQKIVAYYQSAYNGSSSCRLFNAGKERRSRAVESQEITPLSNLYRTVTRQPHQLSGGHQDRQDQEDRALDSNSSDSDDENQLQEDCGLLSPSPVPPQLLFDTENAAAVEVRDQIALATLQKMCLWLESQESHRVAIFDATNTTVARRGMIVSTMRTHVSNPTPIIFIESICNDAKIVNENINHKVNHSPDYLHEHDKDWCYRNFQARLANYERVYEPCDITKEFPRLEGQEPSISQIRVYNQGSSITLQGHASLLHETGLMRQLHNTYNNSLRAPDSLPRVLDSISKAHSSCSSSSSSLFSFSGLTLGNNAFEMENVQRVADEAASEQKQLQQLAQEGEMPPSQQIHES